MNAKVAKMTIDVALETNTIGFTKEKVNEIAADNTFHTELSCMNCKEDRIISKVFKRTIDICAGVIGSIILIPLTLYVWSINKISKEDGGPIFYTQERIGRNGKVFKMIKYRSMIVDADEKLENFLNENENIRKEFYIYRKIKNDPRVTKVGKILRKTSLDEFPQFLHLLTGDMSLVGPRPYLLREKEQMGEYYKIITKYKPGITGLWQTEGRSNVTFDNRLDMDIRYHKFHSNIVDLKIVLKTIENVINNKGAI